MKTTYYLSKDNLVYLLNFLDPKTLSIIAQVNKMLHEKAYEDKLWAKFVTKSESKNFHHLSNRDFYIKTPHYRNPIYRDYDEKGRLYSFMLFKQNDFIKVNKKVNPNLQKKFEASSKKIKGFIQSGKLTLNKLKDFVDNAEKIANIENNIFPIEHRRLMVFIAICEILAAAAPLIEEFSISPDWLLIQVEQSERSNYKEMLDLQVKTLKETKRLIERKLLSSEQVVKFISDIKIPGAVKVLHSLTHALSILPEAEANNLGFLAKFCEDEAEKKMIELVLSFLKNNIAKDEDKKLYVADNILQAIVKPELGEIIELTINYCRFKKTHNIDQDVLFKYYQKKEKSRADLINFIEACINICAVARNSQLTYINLVNYAMVRSGGDLKIMTDCFAGVIHWINSKQLLIIDLWNYACKMGAFKLLGLVEFLLRLETKKIICDNKVILGALVKIAYQEISTIENYINMAETLLIGGNFLSIDVYASYLMSEETWKRLYEVNRVINSLKSLKSVLEAEQLNANSLLEIRVNYNEQHKKHFSILYHHDFSSFLFNIEQLIQRFPSTQSFLKSIIVFAKTHGYIAGLAFLSEILEHKHEIILKNGFLDIDTLINHFCNIKFSEKKNFKRFCDVLATAIILINNQTLTKKELFYYLDNYDYHDVDLFVKRLVKLLTLINEKILSKTIAIKICSFKDEHHTDKLIDIFIKAKDMLKNKAIEPEKLLAITYKDQGISLAETLIKFNHFSKNKITADDLRIVARNPDLPDHVVKFLQKLLNSKNFIKSQTLSLPELVEKLLEPKKIEPPVSVKKYYFWQSAPVNSQNVANDLILASMFEEKQPTHNTNQSFCSII